MRPQSESVGEALRRVEDCAAFLRYAADAGATSHAETPKRALSGMADACEDIQRTVHAVRKSLNVPTLDIDVRQKEYDDAEE